MYIHLIISFHKYSLGFSESLTESMVCLHLNYKNINPKKRNLMQNLHSFTDIQCEHYRPIDK